MAHQGVLFEVPVGFGGNGGSWGFRLWILNTEKIHLPKESNSADLGHQACQGLRRHARTCYFYHMRLFLEGFQGNINLVFEKRSKLHHPGAKIIKRKKIGAPYKMNVDSS